MRNHLLVAMALACLISFSSVADETAQIEFDWGGHVRERFNYADEDLFGIGRSGDDGFLLHRIMVHGDLKVGERFRVFAEIGHHIEEGRDNGPGPFDENRLDLGQAYIELNATSGSGILTLRAGRQTMPLGSARLIGKRFGPNVPLAFNAMRGIFATEGTEIHAFAGHPVQVFPGTFDDNSDSGQTLWGVYLSTQELFKTGFNADVYYLGLKREDSRFAQGQEDEKRHSAGFRLFGENQAWDWNIEGVYQFGDFGGADIRAWTIASDTGYTFADKAWMPRIGLKANYASGDDDPNDNELGTFNPLFPNLAYFNQAAFLSPQNFFNLQPSVTLKPHKSFRFTLSWNAFWRAKTSDSVYVRGLRPLTPADDGEGRFTAHVPTLDFAWELLEDLTFNASYSRFIVSDTIKAAGGDDADTLSLWMTYKF